MKKNAFLLPPFILLIFALSCKKEKTLQSDCYKDMRTVRVIENQNAIVKKAGNEFFLVENGAIDTRLKACSLPQQFQVNDLPVTITGNVKETQREGICCTDNFELREIK